MTFTPVWQFLGLSFLLSLLSFSTRAGVNGPDRIGVVTGKPFVYLIPATGQGPLRYSASGLPEGLALNPATGVITGTTQAQGNFAVTLTVIDSQGRHPRRVSFVSGPNAIALTPPMGWNSWYVHGCNISDQKIRQAADLLVSTGLAAHGYNYVNIDDCWQSHRDQATGEVVPKPSFPNMKALADYVHSKGLRIGIYTSPGAETCGHHPGSGGHLAQDVATYARWGMDFVKYDWCMFRDDPRQKRQMFQSEPAAYQAMSNLLYRSPRAMVHQICQYGEYNVWEWGARVGGNLWRTNNDLADVWQAVVRNGFNNVPMSRHQSGGHWNDLDMLIVGKSNWPRRIGDYEIPQTAPRPTQLTPVEQYTHITLWALMASPLIFSGDLTQIDPLTRRLITNDDVLAVNQDRAAHPAEYHQFSERGDLRVITRRLADGALALGLFNLTGREANIRVSFAELGLAAYGPHKVRDLWSHAERVSRGDGVSWNVAPHGAAFFRITPQN